MNPILMKAILAMDAYNRGYNPSIKFGDETNGNSIDDKDILIGNAKIFANSSSLVNAQGNANIDDDISFYAIAYDYNGEKVISYRGTDDPALDGLYGWGVALGSPREQQALMAFQFYKEVAGNVDPRTANISLTGHSMGAGLAGLVGAAYTKEGLLFDNMAFANSANNLKDWATSGGNYSPDLHRIVYNNATPWNVNFSGLTGLYMKGESLDSPDYIPGWVYSQPIAKTEFTLGYDGNDLSGRQKHSMSSLVMTMYADGLDNNAWTAAAQYFWPVLYNDTFAGAIGFANSANTNGGSQTDGKYSDILRTVLAYSAIDEGTRVFGDTGIVSLYDDANDLGSTLTGSLVNPSLTQYAAQISQAFVQFAGLLALNKIEKEGKEWVTDGILKVDSGALIVDFSDSTWQGAAPGGVTAISARDSLVNSILSSSGASSSIRSKMTEFWGNNSGSAFGKIVIPVSSAGDSLNLYSSAYSANKATLVLGTSAADYISTDGGNNLVISGSGDDTIYINGRGESIIIAGAGNDYVTGNWGSEYYHLGTGTDRVVDSGYFGRDEDHLVLSQFGSTSVTLNFLNGTYSAGSSSGQFEYIEKFVLGGGNDSIIMRNYYSSGRDRILVDAGGGVDTVRLSPQSYVTGSNIYSADQTQIINYERIDLSGMSSVHSFNVLGLGSQFIGNGGQTMVNYSGVKSFLNFSISSSSAVVSGNSGSDNYNSVNISRIYGTHYGDNYNIENRSIMLHTGRGDDTIRIPGGSIYYSGGNDTIVNYNSRELTSSGSFKYGGLTVYLPHDVPASAISKIYNYDARGRDILSVDVTVPGYGSIRIVPGGGLYGPNNLPDVALGTINFISLTKDSFQQISGFDAKTVSGDIPLIGELGNDTINGSVTGDTLEGNFGNDKLYGNEGDDSLYGGAGNDQLFGGAGNDSIYGGSGNDYIWADEFDTVISGGIGIDTVDFSNAGSGMHLSFYSGYIAKYITDNSSIASMDSFENFVGSNLTDIIEYEYPYIPQTSMSFDGKGGNDKLVLSFSSPDYTDSISNEITYYMTLIKTASGSTFNLATLGLKVTSFESLEVYVDRILVKSTDDSTIYGTSANDVINGTTNDDALNGLAGNDTLNANAGNDILDGGTGMDTLNGAGGNDIYNISANSGLDTITDSSGTDKIVFGTGISQANTTYARSSNDLVISVSGAQVARVTGHFAGTGAVEILQFSNGTTVNLTTLTFPINGTSGNNTLIGTAAADTINGLAGNDILYGAAGNDTLNGGDGNDTLYGEAGSDTLRGEAGNDIYVYDGGQDKIYETSGTDILRLLASRTVDALVFSDIGSIDTKMTFSSGNDITLYGQRGTNANLKVETVQFLDGFSANLASYKTWTWGSTAAQTTNGTTAANTILGRGGNDTINGLAGNDNLHGGSGNDTIKGGDGNDLVHGGIGNDMIYGDAGNDIIYGDDGLDNLYGGTGADIFMFLKETAFKNIDVINDFSKTQNDKISIKDLLQGYDPLTKAITDFVQITTSGSNSILKVDADGGANGFVQIATIKGITGLTDEASLVASGHLIVT